MNILFLLLEYSNLHKELVHEFRDNEHNVYVETISEKKKGFPPLFKKKMELMSSE